MAGHEALLCKQWVSQCCSHLKHRGSGTVVVWAETVTIETGQCGSGGDQSVCCGHCVSVRSDNTDSSMECELLSTSVSRLLRHHGRSWAGVAPNLDRHRDRHRQRDRQRQTETETDRETSDSPVRMIVPGLLKQRRRNMMDGLRRFIMVDNHEAVEVGEFDMNMESKKVVEPKFTIDIPEVIREGADALTLRAEEEGMLRIFIDATDARETADGGLRSWMRTGVPLVRPLSMEVEGSDWETLCCNNKYLHIVV